MSIPSSGSSTPRIASITSSLVTCMQTSLDSPPRARLGPRRRSARSKQHASKISQIHAREARLEVCPPEELALRALKAVQTNLFAFFSAEEVDSVDEADPVAAGAHDDRVAPRA